jgi:hypothetical protein
MINDIINKLLSILVFVLRNLQEVASAIKISRRPYVYQSLQAPTFIIKAGRA